MNNQAPELSPEARRLINEARGADDPTAEDHARVKARWLASVAAVAGVSSLTEAARAAGGIGWGFKAAGAALVIAAGAIGLNFALDTGSSAEANPSETTRRIPLPGWNGSSPERFQKTARSDSEKAEQAPSLHAVAAPAPAAPGSAVAPGDAPTPVPAGPAAVLAEPTAVLAEPKAVAQPEVAGNAPSAGAVEAAPEALAPATAVQQRAVVQPGLAPTAVPSTPARAKPVPRAVVARSSAPKAAEKEASAPVEAAATAAGPSGQLSEELALLSDVRGSIQEGAAGRALELLNRYESRFGQPILGMEADALRVDALCRAGQREAARESARAFQNEWPGSPLERRVSAACP